MDGDEFLLFFVFVIFVVVFVVFIGFCVGLNLFMGFLGNELYMFYYVCVFFVEEMFVVGYGDKVKCEVGELVEDLKEERVMEERDKEREKYRE